jgi:hypothetical protein
MVMDFRFPKKNIDRVALIMWSEQKTFRIKFVENNKMPIFYSWRISVNLYGFWGNWTELSNVQEYVYICEIFFSKLYLYISAVFGTYVQVIGLVSLPIFRTIIVLIYFSLFARLYSLYFSLFWHDYISYTCLSFGTIIFLIYFCLFARL